MSFNSKKISQIIVKKDMLILRILEFQNSFQSIYFNPHSFTPQYILNSLAEAFEGIITFWNFLYSWIALRIEYRDFSSLLPILPIRTAHKPDMFILSLLLLGGSLKWTLWSFYSAIIVRTAILIIKAIKMFNCLSFEPLGHTPLGPASSRLANL